MINDLFDATSEHETATKGAEAAAQVAACHASDIPAPILALEKVYRAEIELRAEIEVKEKALNAQLHSTGFKEYGAIDIGGRHGAAMNRERLTEYVPRVVRYAQHALSAAGAPFTGDLDSHIRKADDLVRSFYRSSDESYRSAAFQPLVEFFSPIALWREIYKAFDPEEQRKAANRIGAHRIRSEFGMLRDNRPPEMKIVKGRVEVVITVWTTTQWGGTRSLSHNTQLPELGTALQQAMIDNGLETTFGQALTALAQELHEYKSRPIISRERVNLGDGVDIVLGYEAFKLYLPQEFANAVNMFLAEYPDDDGRRRR